MPSPQKKIEQGSQFKGEDGFRNHDAGEQPCADAGTGDQSGVEGGSLSEKTPGKKIDHQDKRGDGKHQRQPGLKGALPEKFVADGNHPVMERGFFEIANAVLIHHDPVAALQHLAGNQRVRGVGIVEQRRLSGGGDVNSERQNEQGEDGESAIHLMSKAFCLSLCRTGVVGGALTTKG